MSDEKKWAVKNHALFADNQQRAAEMLCDIADNVPDVVTDSWMKTAGFSSLSGTYHGQKLVRELMRVTLAHVAAPIVAEQWLIKAELENQRDARLGASVLPDAGLVDHVEIGKRWGAESLSFNAEQAWSEVQAFIPDVVRKEDVQQIVARVWSLSASVPRRAAEHDAGPQPHQTASSSPLPNIVKYYDRELDVVEILDECALAWKQDRPCKPDGDPMMVHRLAHIVRTYRELSASITSFDVFIPVLDESTPMLIGMLSGKPAKEAAKQLAVSYKDVCQHLTNAQQTASKYKLDAESFARLVSSKDDEIAAARHALIEAGAPDKPLVELAKLAAVAVRELKEIREIASVGDNEETTHVVRRVMNAHREMADERGRIHSILTRRGKKPETDNMADAMGELLEAIDTELDKLLEFEPCDAPILDRIRSIAHLVDSKDAALTALYQDIRTILGPVQVTDADREAVSEKDAANGPDAREYYAERKALLRVVAENAKELKDVRQMLLDGMYMRENEELRTVVGEVLDELQKKTARVDELAAANASYASLNIGQQMMAKDQRIWELDKELKEIREILTTAGFALANGLVASVRTLAERNDRGVADKLKDHADILRAIMDAGYSGDSCSSIVRKVIKDNTDIRQALNEHQLYDAYPSDDTLKIIKRLAKGDTAKRTEPTPDAHDPWHAGRGLDVAVSIPLLRTLTAIITEYENGGPPMMITRRKRIVRMHRALLALAATHGVELDEHVHDDL